MIKDKKVNYSKALTIHSVHKFCGMSHLSIDAHVVYLNILCVIPDVVLKNILNVVGVLPSSSSSKENESESGQKESAITSIDSRKF